MGALRNNITDRGLRYRANNLIPEHEHVCAFCGARGKLMVAHVDGNEDNFAPDNLTWSCRSCNGIAAHTLSNAGLGRKTYQYNPTRGGGASSLGEWMNAVFAITPHQDRGARPMSLMSVSKAVEMIRATPHAKRSQFAKQIRQKRGKNPIFGPHFRPADVTPARGGIAAHLGRGAKKKAKGLAPSVRSIDEQRLMEHYKRGGTLKEFLAANPGLKKRNPALFDRCVKAVKAKGGAVSPYAVCTAAMKKKRKNPSDAAAEAFEDFHGYPSTELVTVKKKVHHHKHLPSAGELRALRVKGIDHKPHVISGFKGAILCFNEARNQLFVEGGDQSLNLEDFGISEPHEIETLGKLKGVDYFTTKTHLGKDGGTAVYDHGFRMTNENGQHVVVKIARYPDLIYRVLDEQLEFSGGSYTIRREGIDL